MSMPVCCVDCGKELTELHDTTVSNVENERCYVGQLTGQIYYCEKCEIMTIDNLLDGTIEQWLY